MARRCYIGAGGKAKEVQYIYIGIDDVARPVRKCYVGVNGVARPCWTGLSVPEYYGTVTGFRARYNGTATPAGNVLVIAGGGDADHASGQMLSAEGINKNLELVAVPDLPKAPAGEALAVSTEDHAIFGLGSTESSQAVGVYDRNLVVSLLEGVGFNGQAGGVSFNGYGIFAGGGSVPSVNIVRAIDNNLVVNELAELAAKRYGLKGVQNGAFALFGGGMRYATNSTRVKTVEGYDRNLVKVAVEDLSQTKRGHAAARAGKYAMFGGGYGDSTSTTYATTDAYDRNLVKAEVENFTTKRYGAKGVTIGECALFGGGSAAMECYDNKLVKCDVGSLSTTATTGTVRRGIAAGVIGDYALFIGGGTGYSTAQHACDVFVS